MIVPVTFLNITQALREIKAGESVEIIGSDSEPKGMSSKSCGRFPMNC